MWLLPCGHVDDSEDRAAEADEAGIWGGLDQKRTAGPEKATAPPDGRRPRERLASPAGPRGRHDARGSYVCSHEMLTLRGDVPGKVGLSRVAAKLLRWYS
jgi:hypothetical protein